MEVADKKLGPKLNILFIDNTSCLSTLLGYTDNLDYVQSTKVQLLCKSVSLCGSSHSRWLEIVLSATTHHKEAYTLKMVITYFTILRWGPKSSTNSEAVFDGPFSSFELDWERALEVSAGHATLEPLYGLKRRITGLYMRNATCTRNRKLTITMQVLWSTLSKFDSNKSVQIKPSTNHLSRAVIQV